MKTENYLRELYFIFFTQKMLIFFTTAIIFVLSILIAFYWPPTFSASGNILVRGKKIEKSPEAIEEVNIRTSLVSKEDLASEEKIISSPDVITKTIEYLRSKGHYSDVEGEALFKEVYNIQKNLRTQLIPASNVIEITYFDRDPQNALSLLEALMNQYIEYRLQVYNPDQAGLFFSEQADKYRDKLMNKEDELLNLLHKTEVSSPKKELENNIMVKNDLQLRLNTLNSEAIEKNLYVKHLEKALRSEDMPLFSFIENVPINQLSSKLQELLVERGKILRAYSPNSDKAKLINRHINDTYRLFQSEVRAHKENQWTQLQIILDKIKLIQNKIVEIDKRNVTLQEQTIELDRIERDASIYKFSYDIFSKRREETGTMNSENVPSQISIVKKAFPSDGPVFPKKNVVIPFGLLVGFITGCSLGFLREYFDHTFKKPSDVEKYAGLPVIFSIPNK
jgi:uncharacterized protein involved in exopolysaccharide biosynthesis